jgi:hypothetical protein
MSKTSFGLILTCKVVDLEDENRSELKLIKSASSAPTI